MRKTIVLAVIAGATVIGCGEERKDATTDGQTVDRSAAEVIAFPDAFRNVAHKCDGHGHRVYSSSTGVDGNYPQVVVVNDETCE